MYYPFNEQRGAYKVLMRNRFIFIKNDLHPVMENIVLLHELGHDVILSILVDTFISKISLPMQPVPEIGSISGA